MPGAVQVSVVRPLRYDTPTGAFGASGTFIGITAAEATDEEPVPEPFVAVTVNR